MGASITVQNAQPGSSVQGPIGHHRIFLKQKGYRKSLSKYKRISGGQERER